MSKKRRQSTSCFHFPFYHVLPFCEQGGKNCFLKEVTCCYLTASVHDLFHSLFKTLFSSFLRGKKERVNFRLHLKMLKDTMPVLQTVPLICLTSYCTCCP